MIHSAYRIVLVFMLSLMAYTASANSTIMDTCRYYQDHEVRKTIHHEFPLNNGSTVKLYNKYGAMNIHTWDKQEVHIDVEIIVNSSSKSNAELQLDHIEIQVHNQDDYLKVATILTEQDNNWWTNIWGSCKSELVINYDVFIPKSSNLIAENKYGDTSIEDLDNDLNATVKYGNLTTSNSNGSVGLSLGYGKSVMGNIGNLEAEVKYSEIYIESVKNIFITSKNSDLTIRKAYDMTITSKYDSYQLGEIGELTNEGKYDSFKIDSANSIEIESKYSTVKAMYLEKSIDAEMKYGSIEIHEVSNVFDHAVIDSKNTDIYLNIDVDFQYEIESNYATPKIAGNFSHSDFEQNGSHIYVEGVRGKNPTARVMIETKYGSIKID